MNPNSKLWLCKTKLERDYKNTLTFSTKNAQRNYFIGDPANPSDYGTSTKRYNDFTYLRIENAIKVDEFIENIDTNNYAVILNNTKYYYYFITSMDYIDETTTKIHIELDVMQTYFFDIEYNNTFIEREHVADDTFGKHTIPEGLETGEYVPKNSGDLNTNLLNQNIFENWSIIISVTMDNDIFGDLGNLWYGGVFSGSVYLEFSGIYEGQAGVFLRVLNAQNKIDDVNAIFMLPTYLLATTTKTLTYGGVTMTVGQVTNSREAVYENVHAGSMPTTIGTYTPRNNKLLINDYNYLLIDNGSGGAKKYNYEDFSNPASINFDVYFTPCPSGSTLFVPNYYKNVNANFLESIAGAKFPMCSWASDPYINWLTQNGINNSFSTKENIIKSVGGLGMTALGGMTGNIPLLTLGASSLGAGISNQFNDVMQEMQEKKIRDLAPTEISGNIGLGDVCFADFRNAPKYYYMQIKEEYARVLDKFFDMFGYKVDIVKTPSIHTRSKWNYLKTKSCNFTGNIPQEYITKIKNIFDTGITFWHDPSKMLDYSQTNSILS